MKSLIFFAQTFTISSTNWQTWSALLPVSTSKCLTFISKFWFLYQLIIRSWSVIQDATSYNCCICPTASLNEPLAMPNQNDDKSWIVNKLNVVLFTCFQGLTVWRYRLNPTDYSVGLRLWSTDNFFWNNKFSKN